MDWSQLFGLSDPEAEPQEPEWQVGIDPNPQKYSADVDNMAWGSVLPERNFVEEMILASAKLADIPQDRIHFTEGYRTSEQNKSVGGSTKSKHMYDPAQAFDLAITGNREKDIAYATELKRRFEPLGFYVELFQDKNHIHLQYPRKGVSMDKVWLEKMADVEFEVDVKKRSQQKNKGVTDPLLELGFDVNRARLIYDRLKHDNTIGANQVAFYSRASGEDKIPMGELFARTHGYVASQGRDKHTARDWWEYLKKHGEIQPEYADDFEKWRDSSMVYPDDMVYLWSDSLMYSDPVFGKDQSDMADVWAHEFRHRGQEMLSREYEKEGIDPDFIEHGLEELGLTNEGLIRMYDWDYGSDLTRGQAVDWLSDNFGHGLGKMDEYRKVQKELSKDAQTVLDKRREERYSRIPQEPPDKTWGNTISDWLFK